MKLSIIIPAYNEEQRLRPALEDYLHFFLPRYGDEAEVLIVVNGSTDRTEQVARDIANGDPRIRVIVEPARVGKGGAVLLGFEAARGALIGFVDADGSTPPAAFQDLVDHIGDAGAIIASRWRRDSKITPQPLSRRIASRLFNWWVRLLFKLPITDTQCGAKVFTAPAIREVLPLLGTTQWAFDVDLLFQLRHAGYRIKEIATVWNDKAGSRLHVFTASMEMFAALIRLRLLYSPLKWVVPLVNRTISRFMPWDERRGRKL
ncbi:MAG: glycosyltransferase family 2 protein [Kiritimatiellaeota bacterium]|nr:glycosyltransferase family 2 protein [Kiritimatiellota bacterium]